MEITTASVAALVPVFQLLGKIIEYLIELQKHSRKHAQVIAELKAAVTLVKKKIEEEIEARKKEDEHVATEQNFTRKLAYAATAVACSSWIYIFLHLVGVVR